MEKYFTKICLLYFLFCFCSYVNAQTLTRIDILPGPQGSLPQIIYPFDDERVILTANGDPQGNAGPNGYEPWISNGTQAGTFLLKNVNPTTGSLPSVYQRAGAYVFFNENFDDSLWRTDGTSNGTIRLGNVKLTDFPTEFAELNGKLYFWGRDNTHGFELWTSNGSTPGTQMVKDIFPGPNSSLFIEQILRIGNTLYFAANNGTQNVELWKSDGTTSGTVIVRNILGTSNGVEKGSRPDVLTNVNGELFFRINSGSTVSADVDRYELWKSNGTSAGTQLVKSFAQFPNTNLINYIAAYNSIALFKGMDTTGYNIWRTNGTPSGTVKIKDMSAFNIINSIVYKNILYMVISDSQNGAELWRSDGTGAGTFIFKNLNPGPADGISGDGNLTLFQGDLYFTGINNFGNQIWKTNGTSAGTVRVTNMNPGGNSDINNLLAVDNKLFFSGDDGVNGNELWVYGPASTFKIATTASSESNTLNAYPNPSSGAVWLMDVMNANYKIYDMLGKVHQSGHADSNELLLNLTEGMYTIEVIQDEKVRKVRVIIQ